MQISSSMTSLFYGAAALALLTACGSLPGPDDQPDTRTATPINPENWPTVETPPLQPEVEARIDEILAQLTLEQKVGQVIQADSGSVTPEEVKAYRLGSVLSGGNSAPGPEPYADAAAWLEAADAYYLASIDPEGVDIAIPTI